MQLKLTLSQGMVSDLLLPPSHSAWVSSKTRHISCSCHLIEGAALALFWRLMRNLRNFPRSPSALVTWLDQP